MKLPSTFCVQTASSALPQALLMQPRDSLSLQRILKAQAQTLERLRANLVLASKDITSIKSPSMAPPSTMQACRKLWWSPVPPTKLLVMQNCTNLQQDLQVIVWNQFSSSWQVLFQICQHVAVAWCMPAAKLVCYRTQCGTLALLDPYDGNLTSSCLMLFHSNDPIISSKGDIVILGSTEQDIAVCQLPTLRIAWYISEPSMHLAWPSCSLFSWIAWAPNGKFLALAGCRTKQNVALDLVSRLRICTAHDGTELASFNCWDQYWSGQVPPPITEYIRFTWATPGHCIAIHRHDTRCELDTRQGGIILVDCTGSHCYLDGGRTVWLAASVTWCRCGQYLIGDGRTVHRYSQCAVWRPQQRSSYGNGAVEVLSFEISACNWCSLCLENVLKVCRGSVCGVQPVLGKFYAYTELFPIQHISPGLTHQLSPSYLACNFRLRMTLCVLSFHLQSSCSSGRVHQLCHVECGPGADTSRLSLCGCIGIACCSQLISLAPISKSLSSLRHSLCQLQCASD